MLFTEGSDLPASLVPTIFATMRQLFSPYCSIPIKRRLSSSSDHFCAQLEGILGEALLLPWGVEPSSDISPPPQDKETIIKAQQERKQGLFNGRGWDDVWRKEEDGVIELCGSSERTALTQHRERSSRRYSATIQSD